MRGYSPETISPRTASSSTKVDDSWGSGGGGWLGGEYIYTYTTDMEPSIILNCIETRGEGLHEHYTHKISNSLFQSQTKSEIIFIYSVSVVVEISN